MTSSLDISSRPALSAIIFDIGGVLLNWNPTQFFQPFFPGDLDATRRFLAEVNFHAWNEANDRGRSFAESARIGAASFPQYAHLFQAYSTGWEAAITGAIQPNIELLRHLKDHGWRLFSLTNMPVETYARLQQKYPFFDWFEEMIVSGLVRLVKPEPAIFHLLIERIGVPAAQCLFIDDHLPNITAAQSLGIQTLHYRSPETLRAELLQLGVLNGYTPAV